MTNQAVIIFDFDDTLVETTIFYNQAKDRFRELMEQLGLYDHDLLEVLNQNDIANIRAYGGYRKECFPHALAQTYDHYCQSYKREVCAIVRREIEELGWWVFEQPPETLPGARETLTRLYEHFPLVLLTRGEPEFQEARLLASGLDGFFHRVYIVHEKNETVFSRIINESKALVSRSWSIGNSLRFDINPAFKIGLNCIYYPRNLWDFENEEPVGPYHEIGHLAEITPLILG